MTLWTLKVYRDDGFKTSEQTVRALEKAIWLAKLKSTEGFASVNRGVRFLWFRRGKLVSKT